MDRLENILVTTDLSEGSKAALKQAQRLATANGCAIHVLHVAHRDAIADFDHLASRGSHIWENQMRKYAQERLAEEMREAGISEDSSALVAIGSPVREILEYVQRVKADLLVIGTTGASARRGVGTVAIRCVRKSPTKVLVVPSGTSGRFDRVLASIDFSALSPVVMQQAARVQRLDNGKIVAAHVYQMPWDRTRWGQLSPEVQDLENEFLSLTERRFRSELCGQMADQDVHLEIINHADYGEGIVEYAKREKADLVIVGATGRTALGYMLLGTTAEKVIRAVGCAVLVVKPASMKAAGRRPSEGEAGEQAS